MTQFLNFDPLLKIIAYLSTEIDRYFRNLATLVFGLEKRKDT